MTKYTKIIGFGLLFLGAILLYQSFHDKTELEVVQAIPDPEESWKEFNVPQHFTVKFPEIPENTIQTMIDHKTQEKRAYTIFVAQTTDGKVYMVSVITFSEEIGKTDDKELMNKIVKEMVDRKEGSTLQKINSTTFQNAPAFDFDIAGKDNSIEGTVFVKDKRVYLLTEVIPAGIKNSEFSFFRNSFHLGD